MNIAETILRTAATFMNFAQPAFIYYIKNFVVDEKFVTYFLKNFAENHGQDIAQGQDIAMTVLLFKLTLPLQRLIHLVGLLCLPLFFYEIVQLYKGIKRKNYSRAYIFEISLLLFVVAINAFDALGFWLGKWAFSMQASLMRKIVVTSANFFHAIANLFIFKADILIAALILHYVLWLYRIFTARKTRLTQSIHE